MNKNDLITLTAQQSGLSRKDTELAVSAALETLADALSSGDKVQISGFGIFEIRQRKARTGRNPHTKQPIHIPATQVPVFKPSKSLKDRIAK